MKAKTLKEVWREVVNRGWTRQGYTCWRGNLIRRINKLYGTKYHNLSNQEILDYLERAKFYKEV